MGPHCWSWWLWLVGVCGCGANTGARAMRGPDYVLGCLRPADYTCYSHSTVGLESREISYSHSLYEGNTLNQMSY